MLAGDVSWSFLGKFRARLILAPVPDGADRNEEMKRRMRLWDEERFEELARRVQGQQTSASRRPEQARGGGQVDTDEGRGRRARVRTALNQGSKAMKGLVGGVASADAATREMWAKSLIPRSAKGDGALTSSEERRQSVALAWGEGNFRQAMAAMKESQRQNNGLASLPQVRLAPLCATGPSGERQEHIDDIVKFAGVCHRRRLFRAIDNLTVRWGIGCLPEECRWLLNTQAMFLRKTREPQCKQFDDAEWLEALGGAEGEDIEHLDVPESAVSDVATQAAASVASGGPAQVRPIQMGEFMRKYISRRLLAVNEGRVSRIMSAMRQLGNGMQGGAEALPIFHQLLYDVW